MKRFIRRHYAPRSSSRLTIIAGIVAVIFLQACGQNAGSTGSDKHQLTGPEGAIASVATRQPEDRCRYACPQKSQDLDGCTLRDVVTVFGPPDKVHYINYYAADGATDVGVAFIYPTKGVDFVYYKDASKPGGLQGQWVVSDYECYAPTTIDAYLSKVREDKDRSGQK